MKIEMILGTKQQQQHIAFRGIFLGCLLPTIPHPVILMNGQVPMSREIMYLKLILLFPLNISMNQNQSIIHSFHSNGIH